MLKPAVYVLSVLAIAAIASGPAHAAANNSDMNMSRPNVGETYKKAEKAVKAGEYREAVSLLNDVIKEKPRHPDALNYLGFSHRKLGDYAIAVSYYKRALSLDDEHRGANEYLGQAYIELGNLNGAEERLAALEKICGTGCDEYLSLKKALDEARMRMKKAPGQG